MRKQGTILPGKILEIDTSPTAFTKDTDHSIFRRSPVCGKCIHWLRPNLLNINTTDKFEQKCEAFPDGIPSEIWYGENTHTTEYDGDNGIRYAKPTREDIIKTLQESINKNIPGIDEAKQMLDAILSVKK